MYSSPTSFLAEDGSSPFKKPQKTIASAGLPTKTAMPSPAGAAPYNPGFGVGKNFKTVGKEAWGLNGWITPDYIKDMAAARPDLFKDLGDPASLITQNFWEGESGPVAAGYNFDPKLEQLLSGMSMERRGAEGLKDGRTNALYDNAGNLVYAGKPYSYDPAKETLQSVTEAAALAAAAFGGIGALGHGPLAGFFGEAPGVAEAATGAFDTAGWAGTGINGATGVSGAAGAAGAAGGGAATSGIDKILGALGTAGSNLVDKAIANPLGTLGTVAGLAGLAGAKPSGGGGLGFDPKAAAGAQGDANKEASWFDAILNRPDMQTPWGSSTWTLREGADPKNPKPGDWINTVALDPAQQALLDKNNQLSAGYADTAQGMLGRVQGTYSNPLDLSGLPGMPDFSSINTDADRARVEKALFDRMEPLLQQDEERARTRLLNTGFEYGSQGTELELGRLNQQKNDARLAAIIQAGTEARGLADSQRANMLAQLQGRQQGFSEKSYERSLPLNELNAFRQGSQVKSPEFQSVVPTNTGAAPEMDALLAQLGLKQNAANNKQAGYNALLQSLAGLGSAWIGG